jgi:hypothetical protein
MITEASEVVGIYAAWEILSGITLWALVRWSASRKLHICVLTVAALVSLICVVFLAYAFTATQLPPRTPQRVLLAQRASPLLYCFLICPFVACIALAQILRRPSITPRATPWLSYAASVFISCISPLGFLISGCALAGVCF